MSYALKISAAGALASISAERLADGLEAVLERLVHDPGVAEHRHEVRVAAPARDDVHVDVVLDARPGHASLVEADVVAMRAVARLEGVHPTLGEGHQLGHRGRIQVLQG